MSWYLRAAHAMLRRHVDAVRGSHGKGRGGIPEAELGQLRVDPILRADLGPNSQGTP